MGGEVDYFDWCDADYMSIHEINAMVKECGCEEENMLYYYIDPRSDLTHGLLDLQTDGDVMDFCGWVEQFKLMEVFCDAKTDEELLDIQKRQQQEALDKYKRKSTVQIEEIVEEETTEQPQSERVSATTHRRDTGALQGVLLLEYRIEGNDRANGDGAAPVGENNPEEENLFDDLVFDSGDFVSDLWGDVEAADWTDGLVHEDEDAMGQGDREVEDEMAREAGAERDSEYNGQAEMEAMDEGDREAEVEGNREDDGPVVGEDARHGETVVEGEVGMEDDGQAVRDDVGQGDRAVDGDKGAELESEDDDHNPLLDDRVVDGLHSEPDSSDEEERGNGGGYRSFIPERDGNDPIFKVGQKFATKKDFRDAVQNYAIREGKPIYICLSDKRRIQVRCKGEKCEWFLYASVNTSVGKQDWILKTMCESHSTCSHAWSNKNMTTKSVANKFQDSI